MQIYLAVTPDKLPEASRFTTHLAHVAYRIDAGGRLSCRDLFVRTRGGVMVLGDRGCGPIRDSGALCREVWRECGNRAYGGVAADFEEAYSPDRAKFLQDLARVLTRNNCRLFVPEAYGTAAPQASVLICTALSGGTLRQRLEEAAQRFGPRRLALDLQRLRMRFPLPCPDGEGTPLCEKDLAALLARSPSVFYSSDLGAKYFTCTQDGRRQFVLFDDAQTLRRKIQAGQERGAAAGFLMFPEVRDILPALFAPS